MIPKNPTYKQKLNVELESLGKATCIVKNYSSRETVEQ